MQFLGIFLKFLLLCLIFSNIAHANCFNDLRTPIDPNEDPFFIQLNKAIILVNELVDDDTLHLALLNLDESILENENTIPVSAVTYNRSNGIVAQVPIGCREIIFGNTEFEEQVEQAKFESQALYGNEENMLAILLLHELGHVEAGHHGEFVSIDKKAAVVNLDENQVKERERLADQFIVRYLKPQAQLAEKGEADFDALFLITFLAQLSFEVSGQASIDYFGERVLNGRRIFWDHSYTHENLEYRLLKINHAINPTDVSKQLLSEYEKSRDNSKTGGRPVFSK